METQENSANHAAEESGDQHLSTSFPPIGIWTVSSIWIGLGIYGFTSFFLRFTYATDLTVDQTVIICGLFILLGYKLMQGSERARNWSNGLTILVLVLVPLNLFAILFWQTNLDFAWFDFVFWIGLLVGLGMMAGYMLSRLRTDQARSWFDGDNHDPKLAKQLTWGLLPVFVFATWLVELNQFWTHKSIKDPFQVDMRIRLVDAETGKATTSVSAIVVESGWNQPFGYGARVEEVTSTENGLLTSFRGTSLKPIRIRVGAKGFESKILEFREDSKGERVVQLDRGKDFDSAKHLEPVLQPKT